VDQPEPEYELKHRITGAVIMVMTAVIVIPLLLSDPALEANNDNSQTQQHQGNKTFRSKIVPLNLNNVNGNGEEDQSDVTVIEDSRPALLDLTKPQTEQSNASETSTEDQENSDTQTTLVMTQEATKAVDNEPSKAAEPEQETTTVTQPPEEVAKLPEEQNLDGWVVRVGTFSKKANVDSVSSLLTNSGFKPKTTVVSTSLGPSTRVWLGPYAKRETADKISDRLKSLTGEKGYVTRTSS
ncbi:MAG: SPOR domain-containing protein, partial [bacterium]